MTNEIQKQYDRLEDVPSIMLRIKDVYAIPDRHIRYATTKAFFGTKMTEGSSVHSHGVKMLSLMEKLEDLKAGLTMTRKGARRWKRKKGKGMAVTATASTRGAPPAAPKGKGKGNVRSSQVLQRSRKLSKDEMILKLGDGKAVAAEAVESLRLIWHARLGHISKDRIRRLVDSKNLEIDNLDHLPTCESCLKGNMTKKPFVGQSAIANGLLDLVHTDVCGPLSSARGGFSYFITFTDDHSRTQTPYEIWHGKPASYKYLRLWVALAYVKRLVGDKLDSRSSLCSILEKGFSSDSRHDEVLIEESNKEPHRDTTTSFEPTVHTDSVPISVCQLESLEYLIGLDPRRPPKGARPVGCKWVYKCKLGANGEVTAFKARLVAKGYTQRPGVNFEETYSPVAMAKSIRILLAIAACCRKHTVCCPVPDVTYALSVTSRYQACAGEAHWGAVKSILKYLKRTKDMFLIYGGGELILEGYSDASFESDDDDAKSESGFIFKLNGGVVAWKSSKQIPQRIPPRKLNTSQLRKLRRRRFG
ncbi:UNVERIFIED_CONTAM: Retrovirus-related Pol polyprotein from transposon RE2 [Sesamum radiatum]|uniref:Retrovirus-related Pol polyprotein from transposon RE2 n=1 Tax=Sesamum radiatum TaxID=300843 RepID=A0AAW2TY09_SESRA